MFILDSRVPWVFYQSWMSTAKWQNIADSKKFFNIDGQLIHPQFTQTFIYLPPSIVHHCYRLMYLAQDYIRCENFAGYCDSDIKVVKCGSQNIVG